MGPCMPIILSALSAYIHAVYIAVERKCQTPQVATENRQSERVCEIADASVSFQSEVWKHFPCAKRLENVARRPKKNQNKTVDDITLRHLFVYMVAAKVHLRIDQH